MYVFFNTSSNDPAEILNLLIDSFDKIFVSNKELIDGLGLRLQAETSQHPIKRHPKTGKSRQWQLAKELPKTLSIVEFSKIIPKVDCFIFEVTNPKAEIIHQIATVIDSQKPIIILHDEAKEYPPAISKWQNIKHGGRIILAPYAKATTEKTLKEAISQASKIMGKRISFKLKSPIYDYLEWKQKEQSIPKATFIRKILEDKMKKDQKYKRFLKKSS